MFIVSAAYCVISRQLIFHLGRFVYTKTCIITPNPIDSFIRFMLQ